MWWIDLALKASRVGLLGGLLTMVAITPAQARVTRIVIDETIAVNPTANRDTQDVRYELVAGRS